MSHTTPFATAAASVALFERAVRVMPGGVNSPVRAFRAVGGEPRFLARGAGARVWDEDGREYIDCIGSWGPLILGHADARVVERVEAACRQGMSFGAPCTVEIELAETVVRAYPGLEQVRFVSSGTEAVMSAIRLARGATGRPGVVKFEGCYHGHGDSFLVRAGSGAATFGTPDSPGVTESVARDTFTVPYNDLAALERTFIEHGAAIAAVIVEPVVGNMGVVLPRPGFLPGLRDLCTRHGAVLIFDEVMTGFRLGPGGAQGRFGVTPDLTTLGKIIGGGLPVGAYGGRRDLMERISPAGPVYQAGTMSGNPLAMAAGLAALDVIAADHGLYDRLEHLGRALEDGVTDAIHRRRARAVVARAGSMWTVFFTDRRVDDWSGASAADTKAFARYFQAMLAHGVLLAPSQFEANFLSAAHTDADVQAIVRAADTALEAARD
jgi:glutamate-1-semialdehyde 2,1-aminomutase